ncbi:MAG: HD-GYP domain-containing protein [Nitrospiria bacterium]
MDKHLHKTLIQRLFLIWLVLSIIIGALVFYLEIEKIDPFVENLAEKESRTFSSRQISTFLNKSAGLDQADIQHDVEKRLSESHFIVAELYNQEKKKVIEVVKPGYADVEHTVDEKAHDLYLSDLTQHKTVLIDGRIYLQIFTPLKMDSATTIGFFEGIYEVDDETMGNITEEISVSLLEVLFAVLATTVTLYPVIISLNKHLIRFTKDLMRSNISTLNVLGGAIAKRDCDTHEHNFRVTLYAIRLAEASGMKTEKIRGLIKGAFLHDVGKIGVSDTILLKPGRLTAEETTTMQSHVLHGVDIIKENEWLVDGVDVVRCHHEKFDGTGYPAGLKGKDIPLAARIFIICDVFDALTSKRPYKDPIPLERALAMLKEERGTRFDPGLLDKFIAAAPSFYREIAMTDEKTLHRMLDRCVLGYFSSL